SNSSASTRSRNSAHSKASVAWCHLAMSSMISSRSAIRRTSSSSERSDSPTAVLRPDDRVHHLVLVGDLPPRARVADQLPPHLPLVPPVARVAEHPLQRELPQPHEERRRAGLEALGGPLLDLGQDGLPPGGVELDEAAPVARP